MSRLLAIILLLLSGSLALAQDRVSGENSYALREVKWTLNDGVYWQQENFGTYTVGEGPIAPGFVECIGAGFGGASGVRGEGICIFRNDEGSFTWTWQAIPGQMNNWQVAAGTGRYEGMTGSGTAKSKIHSEFTAMAHRVTSWEGQIKLRE